MATPEEMRETVELIEANLIDSLRAEIVRLRAVVDAIRKYDKFISKTVFDALAALDKGA